MSAFVTPKQRRKEAAYNDKRRHQEERIAAGIRLAASRPILCQCRNHLGERKTPHETRAAAHAAIVGLHGFYGNSYRVYKCPKSAVWHVATKKQ